MRRQYSWRAAARHPADEARDFISIWELTRLLRCSTDAVQRLVDRGELVSYLAGPIIRFRRTEIEEFLRRHHRHLDS